MGTTKKKKKKKKWHQKRPRFKKLKSLNAKLKADKELKRRGNLASSTRPKKMSVGLEEPQSPTELSVNSTFVGVPVVDAQDSDDSDSDSLLDAAPVGTGGTTTPQLSDHAD